MVSRETMRDIRPDLQERLALLRREIEDLERELELKQAVLESTAQLLARENEYWSQQEDMFPQKTLNGHKPSLMEFIRDTLSHGESLTLQEISDRARAQG